jgi:hypothetical protein
MSEDAIDRINRHLMWSQAINAPVRDIPGKSVKLVELIQPWLVANTTPREAGIVLAAAYLYFAGILLQQDDDPEANMARNHQLLDTAASIIVDIEITDEEEE